MTKQAIQLAASAVVSVLVLLVGEAHAANPSDYTGVWDYNVKESINMPHPDVKSETVEVKRHDSILEYTWVGVDKDGTSSNFSFSGPVDGKVKALPGMEGLRGSMTRTPDGIVEARLWAPDGSFEDKFCILSSPKRLTCFATYTDGNGKVSLFKQLFDKRS